MQVDPPHEIYDHPRERFVADFIGDTNFLNVKVLSVSGDTARLQFSSSSEIDIPASADLTPGGEATVAVRPEQATLSASPGAATLSGVVKDRVYFGTDTHYHIALPDATLFTARPLSWEHRAY